MEVSLSGGTEKAYRAQLDVRKVQIMALVKAGKDAEVGVEIDRFVAAHPGNSYMPVALSGIAELYYAKSEYQKALSIWKKVIYELPDCIGTARAWLFTGDVYAKLGDLEKAVQCYEKVSNDYPKWRLGWHATFLVGRTYEQLKQSGAMSESEADAKTRAAYELVLERYPDCEAAEAARQWLGR